MQKDEIIDAILVLLAREFSSNLDRESLTSNQTITELCGLDSLGFVRFVCAIEKEFGISFDDDVSYDSLNRFDTLADEIMKVKAGGEGSGESTASEVAGG